MTRENYKIYSYNFVLYNLQPAQSLKFFVSFLSYATYDSSQCRGLEHTTLLFILYAPLTDPTQISESDRLEVWTIFINTLRTGDADLRFYITTVQDGWRKSAFLTRACFPCTVYLIMQYIEPVSEWSCWRMFIETWPPSELTFRHRASSI